MSNVNPPAAPVLDTRPTLVVDQERFRLVMDEFVALKQTLHALKHELTTRTDERNKAIELLRRYMAPGDVDSVDKFLGMFDDILL
jgi:hypothetical protein